MALTSIDLQTPLLDPPDAARLLGLKNQGTLANWRSRNFGPPYVKCGASVKYRMRDVAAWIEQRVVKPTTGSGRTTR